MEVSFPRRPGPGCSAYHAVTRPGAATCSSCTLTQCAWRLDTDVNTINIVIKARGFWSVRAARLRTFLATFAAHRDHYRCLSTDCSTTPRLIPPQSRL